MYRCIGMLCTCTYTTPYIGHWVKYDDDDVSMVTEEEVLKLSGGGEWVCVCV